MRLLVLGESHYSKEESPAADLTQRITRDYIDGKWTHPFWTKVARTISGAPLERNECRALWRSVAFYNFVQDVVGAGPRIRPTPEMWLAAHRPFFHIVRELEPQAVLVLGKQLWGNLPEGLNDHLDLADGTKWPVRVYEGRAGSRSIATFINHPASRGFSWRKWNGVVAALRDQTRAP